MELASLLRLYDYKVPPELIAQAPAKPRDSSRLLVYTKRGKKICFDIFKNIGHYLPKNAVLVFNQTKVWPAWLIMKKTTGGKAEILYISHNKNFIKVLSSRKLPIGQTIMPFNGRQKVLWFKVVKREKEFYFLRPSFPLSQMPDILKKYGRTPLPPYIKNSPLTEKQRRGQYQSVFAKAGLSVAAPTASLHFTKKLISNLRRQGIAVKFVQLDVGLGTFAPLKEENLTTDKLHREFYFIDKATSAFLNKAKAQGRPIIAVGTTVARTLESASASFALAEARRVRQKPSRDGSSAKHRKLAKLTGTTDLFIRDDYQFKFIDGLITNFHVPKSSLLMLVSAFAGRKTLLNLYKKVIKKRFRLFSFGDGMVILP